MSIRLEMLQVARLAPKLLGDSTGLVEAFFRQQQCNDGGFKGRTDRSDLYYTVFGLEGLIALSVQTSQIVIQMVERAGQYLRTFEDGAGLDFVHLCCLARCRGSIRNLQNASVRSGVDFPGLIGRIEAFRSKDGGYNPVAASDCGTAYGCFLALGAYQDLHTELPDRQGLARCLRRLETQDGAWTNELTCGTAKAVVGSTNATAAAVTLLRNLNQPIDSPVGDWLLARAHPQGGFLAVPNAPIPDLLSTATTLHALGGLQVPADHLRDGCLDFVDSLWTNEGGFYGHWEDDHLDCEYTYYGLLALGHLSVTGPVARGKSDAGRWG